MLPGGIAPRNPEAVPTGKPTRPQQRSSGWRATLARISGVVSTVTGSMTRAPDSKRPRPARAGARSLTTPIQRAARTIQVGGVNWTQADRYCRWIGRRLPTEAEWERAARGDSAAVYPTGNTPPTCAQSNYVCDSARPWGTGRPMAVNATPSDSSPFGVRDLAGNVSEWVADYADTSTPPAVVRAAKGGSFGGTANGSDSRVSLRHRESADQRVSWNYGVRCAQ
jgi:formylglycine-generating enzyme required for sulfatase activity